MFKKHTEYGVRRKLKKHGIDTLVYGTINGTEVKVILDPKDVKISVGIHLLGLIDYLVNHEGYVKISAPEFADKKSSEVTY